MTPIAQNQIVSQLVTETVVYELKPADWNLGIRPKDEPRLEVITLRGDPTYPLAVKTVKLGTLAHQIRVAGGAVGGRYDVIRTVTDGVERRQAKFTVHVTRR